VPKILGIRNLKSGLWSSILYRVLLGGGENDGSGKIKGWLLKNFLTQVMDWPF